ncbi:MAG TPA: hypothetical protein VLA20_05615 [Vicinamibacterales bacterium]|nr:hypothetical protein [Vicinamibacterales bacterium]
MAKRSKAGNGSLRPKTRSRSKAPAAAVAGSKGQSREPIEGHNGPPEPATELLERGMLALQRHDFAGAQNVFTRLLAEFPDERALADRAHVYLDLCGRELAARAGKPRTVEERLTAATAALNNASDADAERLAREVLAEQPEHDLALYLLATVEARRGMAEAALQYLSQAVAVSPEAGAQARHDPDFELLRGMALFEELTEQHQHEPAPRKRGAAES